MSLPVVWSNSFCSWNVSPCYALCKPGPFVCLWQLTLQQRQTMHVIARKCLCISKWSVQHRNYATHVALAMECLCVCCYERLRTSVYRVVSSKEPLKREFRKLVLTAYPLYWPPFPTFRLAHKLLDKLWNLKCVKKCRSDLAEVRSFPLSPFSFSLSSNQAIVLSLTFPHLFFFSVHLYLCSSQVKT